jgi:hypothetical protein
MLDGMSGAKRTFVWITIIGVVGLLVSVTALLIL